ncbi:MAG TPA: helix-turn-helix domain-containing protein [Candidatus Thermoplasmatota archaeon]|nr:helix-turn-helix domain-containing protein [Candidatus Thermoplasmatota archaeon]
MGFTAVFGDAPHARVIDFLLAEAARDHTITDIARGASVARPTVYKVMEELAREGLVTKTRVVGNSRFFALNGRSRAVRALARAAQQLEAR